MGKIDKHVAVALLLVFLYLLIGTFMFHYLEKWNYVDSFYFSGITLTSVGYGDLVPTHTLSKIISVFFAFSGIGIVLYAMSIITKKYLFHRQNQISKLKNIIDKKLQMKKMKKT